MLSIGSCLRKKFFLMLRDQASNVVDGANEFKHFIDNYNSLSEVKKQGSDYLFIHLFHIKTTLIKIDSISRKTGTRDFVFSVLDS